MAAELHVQKCRHRSYTYGFLAEWRVGTFNNPSPPLAPPCCLSVNNKHDVWSFRYRLMQVYCCLVMKSGSEVKASVWNAGDPGSIPGSGRSPGERNGNPLQCSCLQNPRDGEAWLAAVYGFAQSWTQYF